MVTDKCVLYFTKEVTSPTNRRLVATTCDYRLLSTSDRVDHRSLTDHMSSAARGALRIDDWFTVNGGSCPFEAPELRPIQLVGVVSNHPFLEDGLVIITSLVQMLDQAKGVARTLNTEYELGAPSAAYAAQLAMLTGGVPLMYNNERVTRAAEQLAYKAERSRRASFVQANVLLLAAEGAEAAPARTLNDLDFLDSCLCTGASVPPLHRLCSTSVPRMHRLCTASAPPLRRFYTTSVPPLCRPCYATGRDAPTRYIQVCTAHPWSGGRCTLRLEAVA